MSDGRGLQTAFAYRTAALRANHRTKDTFTVMPQRQASIFWTLISTIIAYCQIAL